MARRKKIKTPSKQPESSITTHEEEEEMQQDISKLRDQVQQILLTQKVIEAKMYGVEAKMDGLKKGVEAKMKGIEAKMNDVEAEMDSMEAKMYGVEANMDDLKKGMEDFKIDLKTYLINFLQEILTNGEREVKETHDKNKINVNNDFIDSNVESKNDHVPKTDMRKFDGKDPRRWILQMEQFFHLHNVQNT